MIDTDKYEGHDTDKRMKLLFRDNLLHIGNELSDADYHLLADAPLLLAEVERLRGLLDTIIDITLKELKIFDDNCPMINIRDLAYKGILWGNKE